MSDNQTYNVKVIKNKLRDLYYHIQYIGNQPLEVRGGYSLHKEKASFICPPYDLSLRSGRIENGRSVDEKCPI